MNDSSILAWIKGYLDAFKEDESITKEQMIFFVDELQRMIDEDAVLKALFGD